MKRSRPSIDPDFHVVELLSVLFRAAEPLQRRVVHLRRENLNRQRSKLSLVEERDLGSRVEDEREPAVAIDRSAHRGSELLDEEILIRGRTPRRSRDARERHRVAAEIELDSEFLQEMG